MRMSVSTVTVCGVGEIVGHQDRAITHVLSLLDPEADEDHRFSAFKGHQRKLMSFHDIIEDIDGKVMPTLAHVEDVLAYGREIEAAPGAADAKRLLIHCHMGVSRSTASALMLMAQNDPAMDEDFLFENLRQIRPQAWPNSVMIGHADEVLDRGGRLVAALRRHYGHQLDRDPAFAEWMTGLGRAREVKMAMPKGV